jgi:hypothetical protein
MFGARSRSWRYMFGSRVVGVGRQPTTLYGYAGLPAALWGAFGCLQLIPAPLVQWEGVSYAFKTSHGHKNDFVWWSGQRFFGPVEIWALAVW